MQIIDVKLTDLKPYKNNPRKNDKAVEYVVNSIKEFGFKVPIIIDKDYEIVAGHTRLKAAEKLGLKSVPCIMADDLTEEQIKAFRLADNKTAEFAEWDTEALRKELDALYGEFSMEDFGFPVQIENIDLYGEEGESQYEIAAELGEANNYVVLKFDNEYDWDVAVKKLGLVMEETNDANTNIRRHGLGRVIDGKSVIERFD